jgi:hypothetical protein
MRKKERVSDRSKEKTLNVGKRRGDLTEDPSIPHIVDLS